MNKPIATRITADCIRIVGVVQFILSCLGLVSLSVLLFARDTVVSIVSKDELMLGESARLDALELSLSYIII